jgi:transposase
MKKVKKTKTEQDGEKRKGMSKGSKGEKWNGKEKIRIKFEKIGKSWAIWTSRKQEWAFLYGRKMPSSV